MCRLLHPLPKVLLAEGVLPGESLRLGVRRTLEAHMEHVTKGEAREHIPPDSPRMLVREDHFNREARLAAYRERYQLPETMWACGIHSGL